MSLFNEIIKHSTQNFAKGGENLVAESKTITNESKEYDDMKKYLKDIQESYKSFKDRRKGFATFGRGSTNPNNDRTSLRDKYTKEQVQKWFSSPDEYEHELRELSSYLYVSKGLYYQMINFYVNLPTLDYVVAPLFEEFDDKKKIKRESNKAKKYCRDVLEKPNLRKILKAVLKDNAFYGYERKSDGTYYIQKLNPNYCRQGRLVGGLPTIEFDFSYFNNNETKLKFYSDEFINHYEDYKNKKANSKWIELNYKRTMCIPLESEDYNFPALTGIFDDLIDRDEFYEYLKDSTEIDTNKLLVQTVPMNDDGEILVPPDIVTAFQDAISDVLPPKVKLVSTPFKLNAENMTQSKMQQNNGISEMENLIASNSGIAQSIISNADAATSIKINLEMNTSYIFSILEKIEVWIKKRLSRLTLKKYPFTIEFLRTTNINKKDMFEMKYKMLSIGGSLSDVISAMGMNPDNYFGLLKMENSSKIKDLLQIPESIYTSSGKDEGGAPTKDNVGDDGEKTRDTDGNDR